MNANELADAMQYQRTDADMVKQAVTMLRQQQTEIEALKDEVAKWQMSYENCHRTCSGYGMN